ncbi:hypothetical protein CCP4SC76_5900013 [Gammaproteobacteria bacterium]
MVTGAALTLAWIGLTLVAVENGLNDQKRVNLTLGEKIRYVAHGLGSKWQGWGWKIRPDDGVGLAIRCHGTTAPAHRCR